MKKTLFVCCALALALGAQAQWKPVGDKIKTPWSEQVNPAIVLPQSERGMGICHQTGWRCRTGNIRW